MLMRIAKQGSRILHRHVWRRLPLNMRREAIYSLARFLAPSITPNAVCQPLVIVVGMLRQASGLGEAARAFYDALKAAGFEVYGIDLTARMMQEESFPDFKFIDGRKQFGQGTLIIHLGGPNLPLGMFMLGRQLVKDKHIIAHWFWELPRLPAEWNASFRFVHRITVNSEFVAEAVRCAASSKPVHLITYPAHPHPIERSRAGEIGAPFVALVVFNVASSFARKNPLAAIKAFKLAFGSDPKARLIFKYSNAAHWPPSETLIRDATQGAANIELIGTTESDAAMDALYHRADVVMSLHRSEGLGLAIAEAMLRGIPVIGTNWSGSTGLLTPETGIPIPFRMIPVEDPQNYYTIPGAEWADPDVEMAASALKRLEGDPALRRSLGNAALARAKDVLSPSKFRDQVSDLVRPSSIPQRSGR